MTCFLYFFQKRQTRFWTKRRKAHSYQIWYESVEGRLRCDMTGEKSVVGSGMQMDDNNSALKLTVDLVFGSPLCITKNSSLYVCHRPYEQCSNCVIVKWIHLPFILFSSSRPSYVQWSEYVCGASAAQTPLSTPFPLSDLPLNCFHHGSVPAHAIFGSPCSTRMLVSMALSSGSWNTKAYIVAHHYQSAV